MSAEHVTLIIERGFDISLVIVGALLGYLFSTYIEKKKDKNRENDTIKALWLEVIKNLTYVHMVEKIPPLSMRKLDTVAEAKYELLQNNLFYREQLTIEVVMCYLSIREYNHHLGKYEDREADLKRLATAKKLMEDLRE